MTTGDALTALSARITELETALSAFNDRLRPNGPVDYMVDARAWLRDLNEIRLALANERAERMEVM